MRASNFESSDFGDLVHNAELGYNLFHPKPMPRELPLDDETQNALSRADDALGQLAGVARALKNSRLLMGPYAFKEALASARIEGTQADLEEVFTANRRGTEARPDVSMVADYRRALDQGLHLVEDGRRLSFQTVTEVHAMLMGGSQLGSTQLREQPVWLGSPTDRPETAAFVPPVGEALAESLADWEHYLQAPPNLPPLIRAALIHYQFLTIHPFIDGNGRAGRLLVLLFLTSENRLRVPLLYLSPYFEDRRREYYDRLQAVRERGEIQEWCQFFLTAVYAQANDGVERASNLLDLREHYRAELAGSRSRSAEVVEMIFENPVLTTAAVKEVMGVSTQGALNLIRSIESRGWMAQVGSAGRGGSTLWLATEILAAMTDVEPQRPDSKN